MKQFRPLHSDIRQWLLDIVFVVGFGLVCEGVRREHGLPVMMMILGAGLAAVSLFGSRKLEMEKKAQRHGTAVATDKAD